MATRIPSSAAFERSPSPVTPSGSTLRGSGTMSTNAYSTRKKRDRATPDHQATRSHRRAKGIAKIWTAPEAAKNHMKGAAPTCSRIANQWRSPSAYSRLSLPTRAKARSDVRSAGMTRLRPTTRIGRSSAATAIASDEWTIGAACATSWSCTGVVAGGGLQDIQGWDGHGEDDGDEDQRPAYSDPPSGPRIRRRGNARPGRRRGGHASSGRGLRPNICCIYLAVSLEGASAHDDRSSQVRTVNGSERRVATPSRVFIGEDIAPRRCGKSAGA